MSSNLGRQLSVLAVFSVFSFFVIYAVLLGVEGVSDRGRTLVLETSPVVPKLDLEGFNPGNLISDEEFFDASAMDESQVRAFIRKWNAGCVAQSDVPCLQDFYEDVPFHASSVYCPFEVEGGWLDAAGIIAQVAWACQINPQVLLVTLQKEQGLLTASGVGLTASRYNTAMGYGCPDGVACDSQFFGFSNQVYGAAQQFQRYRLSPEKYRFRAGQLNDVPFNVASECGGAEVFIENQATAGLYNYTPYQPNGVALNGGRDKCSTWGNMNFYGFYRAWFK